MPTTLRTSKVVIEIPPHLIQKIYADTVKRVFSRTNEPVTFEIEGIIAIPNVVELYSVSYDMGDVFFNPDGSYHKGSFYDRAVGQATLTLGVVRIFPDL